MSFSDGNTNIGLSENIEILFQNSYAAHATFFRPDGKESREMKEIKERLVSELHELRDISIRGEDFTKIVCRDFDDFINKEERRSKQVHKEERKRKENQEEGGGVEKERKKRLPFRRFLNNGGDEGEEDFIYARPRVVHFARMSDSDFVLKDFPYKYVDNIETMPNELLFYGTPRARGLEIAYCANKFTSWVQTKEKLVDNRFNPCDVYSFINERKALFQWFYDMAKDAEPDSTLMVFGSFFGKGVCKTAGVSNAEKSLLIYRVVLKRRNGSEKFLDQSGLEVFSQPNNRVYSTSDFPLFEVKVPTKSKLGLKNAKEKIRMITESVEKECPIAKNLGIGGLGEGVVWTHYPEGDGFPYFCFDEKSPYFDFIDRNKINVKRKKLTLEIYQKEREKSNEFLKDKEILSIMHDNILENICEGIIPYLKIIGCIFKNKKNEIEKEKFIKAIFIDEMMKKMNGIFDTYFFEDVT